MTVDIQKKGWQRELSLNIAMAIAIKKVSPESQLLYDDNICCSGLMFNLYFLFQEDTHKLEQALEFLFSSIGGYISAVWELLSVFSSFISAFGGLTSMLWTMISFLWALLLRPSLSALTNYVYGNNVDKKNLHLNIAFVVLLLVAWYLSPTVLGLVYALYDIVSALWRAAVAFWNVFQFFF
jgi:hypothetical protein